MYYIGIYIVLNGTSKNTIMLHVQNNNEKVP